MVVYRSEIHRKKEKKEKKTLTSWANYLSCYKFFNVIPLSKTEKEYQVDSPTIPCRKQPGATESSITHCPVPQVQQIMLAKL